jgi:hypothetical protein
MRQCPKVMVVSPAVILNGRGEKRKKDLEEQVLHVTVGLLIVLIDSQGRGRRLLLLSLTQVNLVLRRNLLRLVQEFALGNMTT